MFSTAYVQYIWFLFSVMAREKFGVDRKGTSGALEDFSVQVGKYGCDQCS